ncbi:hypothetical protein AYY19_06850 [Photobacterium aquimaris]|uniref:Uncharacterized protein n=1 Tax=Photobacterium aquimaris TaxID=512643 RepID=A0A2T3IHU7_9GAMM|nr:hypothetical protein [Photobacterium aquimaris]OBU13813.1 hypothetical protein AYY19_06850 [Photobacterium aquimaris]OBU20342.1 hypothetical protein AYY20_15785 [Photobacterium aquimaris]PSU27914.1 hypothetical protein CTM88_14520 [Photobacterium aquimaris]PSW01445.1 hypothetical protein CTM91_07190 [Photobacterium aquimaris]
MLLLFYSMICSFICYKLAEKNNRNKLLWAISGFVFSFISIIALAVIGSAGTETDRQIIEMTKAKFIDLYSHNEEKAKENLLIFRVYLKLQNGEPVSLEQLNLSVMSLQSIAK